MSGTSRPLLWLVALVALFTALGCSGDRGGSGDIGPAVPGAQDERAAERVVATILLSGESLELVGLRPALDTDLPPAEAISPTLSWTFEDATGQVLESGTITAPLLALAEFDANGNPAPETTTAGAATFEVDIPNVDGTFVLTDPATTGKTQSWGGLKKALKLFIQKLEGLFQFKKGSGSSSGSGGSSSAGGSGSSGGSGGSSSAGGGSSSGGTSSGTGGSASSGSPSNAGDLVQMVKPETECVGMTLLVVSEGYTQEEEAKFQADAEQIVGAISVHSGYKEHWKDVAVYRKFFASKESGISDPAKGIARDTFFRVQHDAVVHRSITSASDVPAANVAALAAAKAEAKADAVLYIANISEWAGAALPWNREGFVAAHPQAGLIMSHELAHALFDLADEYSDGTCNPETSFKGPNVALSLKAIPWTDELTKGVSLPTTGSDPNTVGAYEGALYCTTGVYRPQHTCKMRDASVGFCKVCLSQINARFAARTAACHKGTCDHSECDAGGALDKSCSACTSTVCSVKPECCDSEKGWTDECVKIAKSTPGPCRGVCYDGSSSCSHSECEEGGSLGASCSTCAGSVCEKDPYCCSGKWDGICKLEAAKDPYCSCDSKS